jgi:DNA-directed RNA polymerase subunit M/transcription elongation factor TFIIS
MNTTVEVDVEFTLTCSRCGAVLVASADEENETELFVEPCSCHSVEYSKDAQQEINRLKKKVNLTLTRYSAYAATKGACLPIHEFMEEEQEPTNF